ncbi:GNAT family N-acetyltransferase [Actinoplanes sp. NPDC049668]|uniref:GNAT family N-acetyltransferase n=1 Tax=unclassified Actinoplanes TaxID=2626549 RepID=UPI0033AF00BB
MTSATGRLTLRHHGPQDALTMRDVLVPVYVATHAHLVGVDPWNAPEKWWERLSGTYSRTRDFGLVTGWHGDELAGYAFGSPNDTGRLWPAIDAVFPHLQQAGPVYIYREFAVRPDLQRRGYGRMIHDELLRGRPEQAAHLLLRKDNDSARAAYLAWGWKPAGEVKPFSDSETFDAMVLDMTTRP